MPDGSPSFLCLFDDFPVHVACGGVVSAFFQGGAKTWNLVWARLSERNKEKDEFLARNQSYQICQTQYFGNGAHFASLP